MFLNRAAHFQNSYCLELQYHMTMQVWTANLKQGSLWADFTDPDCDRLNPTWSDQSSRPNHTYNQFYNHNVCPRHNQISLILTLFFFLLFISRCIWTDSTVREQWNSTQLFLTMQMYQILQRINSSSMETDLFQLIIWRCNTLRKDLSFYPNALLSQWYFPVGKAHVGM